MRLIDADKLIKIIENDIQMTQSWLDGCKSIGEKVSLTVQLNTIKSYQAIVEDMPTAFDVDKVVEKLDKQINKCNAELTPDCDTVKMFSLCGRRQAFIEAINIIKRQVE